MLPDFLLPETEVRSEGSGPPVALGEAGRTLQVTLGITGVIEQESLDVAIFGAHNESEFNARPLLSFPQKFYTGVASLVLDLSAMPEVRFLQVRWKTNRWGKGSLEPMFRFYVFATAG